MPPGRKPLPADIKAENRRQSLQRYALKNAEALRAKARLRMQRKHDEIYNSGTVAVHRSQARARRASQTYRDRNREEIREADAERKTRARASSQGTKALAPAKAPTRMARSLERSAQRLTPQTLTLATGTSRNDVAAKKAKSRATETAHDVRCRENDASEDEEDSEAEQLWGEAWGDVGPRPRMRALVREPTPYCDNCAACVMRLTPFGLNMGNI
ncbi:hypothetical protein C8R43DRAFT_947470 [Mycena crocata]|nr:hypothetical protein C8R43DRAFT_947470 [Mycena crocata]